MFKTLFFVIPLLLASVATAQSWYSGAGDTGHVIDGVGGFNPLRAYYQTSGTTDSVRLATGACVSVDVHLDSDIAATTTGCEGYIRSCVTSAPTALSTNTCDPVYSDAGAVTLNGDCDAGRCWIYGVKGDIYFDVTLNGSSKTCRLVAYCNPPGG